MTRKTYADSVEFGQICLGTDSFGEDATSFGAGLDIGRNELSFRLEGRYIDGPRDESGALLTAGFSYRFGS